MGGYILGGGVFQAGESVTLQAVPELGYSFSDWGDSSNSTSISLVKTIDSNLSITANFVVSDTSLIQPDFFSTSLLAKF